VTDNYTILTKELKYYGINLIDPRKCVVNFDNHSPKTQGIFKTIRQLNSTIKNKKKLLFELWTHVENLLNNSPIIPNNNIIDVNMEKLFIFSLKDLLDYLLCFDEKEFTHFTQSISNALSRDIRSFNKEQIHLLPDYKISIDLTHRLITRLMYIQKLLMAALVKKKKAVFRGKLAAGIGGPWSRLDLPMEERVFPFGNELEERMEDKQKQVRYRKGLENYNASQFVGEGHYWRELRNEPFSWADRAFDDPYPSRSVLSRP
jgi:hypothetical protein